MSAYLPGPHLIRFLQSVFAALAEPLVPQVLGMSGHIVTARTRSHRAAFRAHYGDERRSFIPERRDG